MRVGACLALAHALGVMSLLCQLVMVGKAAQDVAEVSIGFDIMASAALNDGVDYRATFSSSSIAEEQPVLFVMQRLA